MKQQLSAFLEKAVSPYHAVEACRKELEATGFREIFLKDKWELKKGGKYFIRHFGSTLIAFTVGSEYQAGDGFRIAACHTDFPCFRVKPNPEMTENQYLKLNVEPYGGMILNTWLDRPLSMAGRVSLRSKNVFKPELRLVDFEKPMFYIPNLAIHMNRKVNEGVELNKQTDMLPLCGLYEDVEEKEGFFIKLLAEKLGVKKEDILEYELNLYNVDKPEITGLHDEFLSAPRLDNMTSVFAILEGITGGERGTGINVACFFDNEEIGSRTKQGAGSAILNIVLKKISNASDLGLDMFVENMAESLLLSVDVAHGLHPNQPGKSDPTNKNILGRGFVIKEAASQSYATDSEAVAILRQLCDSEGIPYQRFANRSDAAGGGTLGSIASALLPVLTMDVGVPLLAMHSARELMGIEDQKALGDMLFAFYTK